METSGYKNLYSEVNINTMRIAEESRLPGKNRVEEIINYVQKAGIKRIGIANCIGLQKEAEKLVPLGQLRKRMEEMSQDKNIEIITWCKISLHGYKAFLILQANGYKNVKVLEGGIMAWPYKREK